MELVYEDAFQLVPLFYVFGINVFTYLSSSSPVLRVLNILGLINPTIMVHITILVTEFSDTFF